MRTRQQVEEVLLGALRATTLHFDPDYPSTFTPVAIVSLIGHALEIAGLVGPADQTPTAAVSIQDLSRWLRALEVHRVVDQWPALGPVAAEMRKAIADAMAGRS